MSPDSFQLSLHTKPYRYRQTFPLVGSPTSDGDGLLVDHKRPGAPRSGLTALKFCFKTCVAMKFVDDDDNGMSPRNYCDACIHRATV